MLDYVQLVFKLTNRFITATTTAIIVTVTIKMINNIIAVTSPTSVPIWPVISTYKSTFSGSAFSGKYIF